LTKLWILALKRRFYWFGSPILSKVILNNSLLILQRIFDL
jgi:hypothetical protein